MSTITGTLTRPFTKNPQPLVPPSPEKSQEKTPDSLVRGSRLLLVAGAEPDDRDAWWHKQAEIRELQAANRSLLRRVYDPSTDSDPKTDSALPPLPKWRAEVSKETPGELRAQQAETSEPGPAPMLEAVDSPTQNGAESVASTQVVRTRTESEATIAASAFAKLEGQLQAQEEALIAERARHKEDLQWHQAEAAEERKRLRRDAAKKVAELQSRSAELVEEVQEATAKAKEAERTMHSKISSMRSASQRLRSQLQAEKVAASSETSEERDTRDRDGAQRLEELRCEVESREAASSELELALAFHRNTAREEREVLLKELADLSSDSSQVRSRNAELAKKDEELEVQLARLSGQLKASESAAATAAERASEESLAAGQLRQQVQEAEAKAQTTSQQYQALLDALKKEQEAADSQLQHLLHEAAHKQQELEELSLGGVMVNMHEVPKLPTVEGLASALLTWADEGSVMKLNHGVVHDSSDKPEVRRVVKEVNVERLQNRLAEAEAARAQLEAQSAKTINQLLEKAAGDRVAFDKELRTAQAQLEAQSEKTINELMETAEGDRAAFGQELRTLKRSVRSELDASSEKDAKEPMRQARLEAQLTEIRREREEAVQELRAVKAREAELKKDLESGRRELKKSREAHQIELDLLAAELQQFQEEHGQLEGKLRNCEAHEPILRARLEEAQAQICEESRLGRRALQRQQRSFEVSERENELVTEQFRTQEEHLVAQLADAEAKLVVTKEQLHKVREDKMAERQRLEKQLDKLRAELGEQRQRRQAVEKEKNYVELGGSRQHQEHTAQIRSLRSASKQLTERLDCLESTSESQRRDHAVSEAEAARHREALEERAQAAETWGQELARRLQEAEDRHRELQDEHEVHHRKTHGHVMEAHSFMSRLLHALGHKADELVAFLSGQVIDEAARTAAELESLKAAGESPEALVSRAFSQLSQTLAVLARENTELRVGGGSPTGATMRKRPAALNGNTEVTVSSEAAAKIAVLQKELIKLREQNQDLELERNQLQSSNGKSSASQELEASLADVKQRLRQTSQAKRRAEERMEEYQQEISRQARAHQADLERLQLDVAAQLQQQLQEQDHLKGKLANAERRTKMLEAKLKGRAESQKTLQAEKDAVEEQLRIAAKQLEALLADESKDTDLLQDLAALSKQFDQLHAKHRAQLLSSEEQSRLLQAEQASRKELETKLSAAEASLQAKDGEAVAWQKHCSVLEKELMAGRAQPDKELQKEVARLRAELQEAQKFEPQEVLLRMKRLEEELQESETARRHLERDLKRRPGSSVAGFSAVLEDGEESRPPKALATEVALPSAGQGAKNGVMSTLEEIQETLDAQEKALQNAKTSRGKDLYASKEMLAASKAPSLAELERDFGAYARSVGFQGDVSQLWEEAQAVAATTMGQEVGDSALKKVRDALLRREAPVAADIQLRPQPGGAPTSSPPRRGVPRKPTADAQNAGGHKETNGDKHGHAPSDGRRGSPLPQAAQESFQQAEVLCQRQRFSEAVPFFRRTLETLQESGLGTEPGTNGAVITAEVWAHLGVAMQSLDRVPEAVDSYQRAVSLDPALHVCFANLATLHAYLNDSKRALEYIGTAIELDPENRTYKQLRRQFLDSQDNEDNGVEGASDVKQAPPGQSSKPG